MTILKRKTQEGDQRIEALRGRLVRGNDLVKFSFNIPAALHKEFKRKCFDNEVDMKDVFLEAMRKYVRS